MNLNLTADEVLSTTRAVRRRLDLERPVERDVLEECVRLALQAPTASNRQSWHFVFVTDPLVKAALAELYAAPLDVIPSLALPDYAAGDTRAQRLPAVKSSFVYLQEHLHEVPVLAVPCIEGRLDGE